MLKITFIIIAIALINIGCIYYACSKFFLYTIEYVFKYYEKYECKTVLLESIVMAMLQDKNKGELEILFKKQLEKIEEEHKE